MKSLKQLILLAFLCIFFGSSYGQHTFKAILKDSDTKAALFDATVHVKGTSLGGKTNDNGLVEIKNIPSGSQTIVFRTFGYKVIEQSYVFPLQSISEEIFLAKITHDSTVLKKLLKSALTIEINSREMFMKGIDYSYYYEENS